MPMNDKELDEVCGFIQMQMKRGADMADSIRLLHREHKEMIDRLASIADGLGVERLGDEEAKAIATRLTNMKLRINELEAEERAYLGLISQVTKLGGERTVAFSLLDELVKMNEDGVLAGRARALALRFDSWRMGIRERARNDEISAAHLAARIP